MKRTQPVRKRRSVKKASKGGVGIAGTQSLADQAALAGNSTPAYVSSEPAFGRRPDPGPPPVEAPTDGGERLAPIRWQFPYGFNQYFTPRRNALTPFAVLRAFADTCDLVRLCIETRKDQLCSLDWDIAPRDKRSQPGEHSDNIDEIRQFFMKPDKKRPFDAWLRMAIEDVLVVDALSIYKRRTYGNELYALEIKDGATMLPLLDPDTGDIPDPPNVAYRQIIYGIPMTGGDCTVDDLYYLPRTTRSHTPYGLSPTEAVLLTINAWINREIFNLSYYTDGNVPEGLIEAPAGWNTKQLVEFQEYLDEYLGGDLERRRRLKVVHPGGSKVFQFKEPDFTGAYDLIVTKLICAAFAVPPSEVGFTDDVNKATSQGQENIVYRRGVKPISRYFKDVFDDVIGLELGHPELQFVWSGGEAEDNLKNAQAMQIRIANAVTSVDDERIELGQEPIGLGPTLATPAGPMLVTEFLKPPEPEPKPAPAPAPGAPPNPNEPQPPKPAQGAQEPKPTAGAKPTPPAGEPEQKLEKQLLEAMAADIRKWRAVAIKDAKAGQRPRAWVSAVLPVYIVEQIHRYLEIAGSDVTKIVAGFDFGAASIATIVKAGEARQLTSLEMRTAKQFRKLMATHFKAEGAALVAHLRKGLE